MTTSQRRKRLYRPENSALWRVHGSEPGLRQQVVAFSDFAVASETADNIGGTVELASSSFPIYIRGLGTMLATTAVTAAGLATGYFAAAAIHHIETR